MLSPLDFAAALIAYCAATGASVTSWGRTLAHNKTAGGAANSFHLTWQAADVVYDARLPLPQRKALARHLGLELIAEGDHDHLEPIG